MDAFPQIDPAELSEEGAVPLARYRDRQRAEEHGLVVLSMGLWYVVKEDEEGAVLHVPEEHARSIAVELREFVEEEKKRARQLEEAAALPVHPAGIVMPFLFVTSLLTGFWFQLRFHPWIVELGANSGRRLVEDGEWWRPLTALFLHADWMHLIGNATSGWIFGVLVAGCLGTRRGWLLILAAGVLGNTATALMRTTVDTTSIGASTAVFGALGILTGFGVATAFRLRRFFHYGVVSKLVPLACGLTLLAMQGIGSDPETDVLAHLNGFGVGAVFGVAFGLRQWADLARPSGRT